jgi:hypothetical protein
MRLNDINQYLTESLAGAQEQLSTGNSPFPSNTASNGSDLAATGCKTNPNLHMTLHLNLIPAKPSFSTITFARQAENNRNISDHNYRAI